MGLTIIAAVAKNGIIGSNGGIPWHLPADMGNFANVTMGGILIMGRLTYDSLGRRALRGRENVVITRSEEIPAPFVSFRSFGKALDAYSGSDRELFAIGGYGIYREALPWASRMLITRLHAEPDGDTEFPEFDETEWDMRIISRHPADERHAHAFKFLEYTRKPRR